MLNEKAELSADDSVLGVAVLGFMKCCFTSTKIVGLLGTGAQDVHLDFHTPPELLGSVQGGEVMLNVLRCQLTY